MHRFNKSALTCAIAALTLGTQFASADASSFWEDSSVSGKIRTTYYDVEKSNRVNSDGSARDSSTKGAWTGGLWVDAKSGYAWDFIGFDTSLYSSTKLYINDKIYPLTAMITPISCLTTKTKVSANSARPT